MSSLVDAFKKAMEADISPSIVDCANEVFWILEEDYSCSDELLEDEKFMHSVIEESMWVVNTIDWTYGINYTDWSNIAEDIAKRYNLSKIEV